MRLYNRTRTVITRELRDGVFFYKERKRKWGVNRLIEKKTTLLSLSLSPPSPLSPSRTSTCVEDIEFGFSINAVGNSGYQLLIPQIRQDEMRWRDHWTPMNILWRTKKRTNSGQSIKSHTLSRRGRHRLDFRPSSLSPSFLFYSLNFFLQSNERTSGTVFPSLSLLRRCILIRPRP